MIHFSQKNTATGYSLVELLVAIGLSAMMLSALVQAYLGNSHGSRIGDDISQLHESGRAGLRHLIYDIRLANHWGGSDAEDVVVSSTFGAPITASGGCTQAWIVDPSEGLRGYDGQAAIGSVSGFPAACITAANYVPDTDILVLRYADSSNVYTDAEVNDSTSGAQKRVFMRASATGSGLIFATSTSGPNTDAFTSDPVLGNATINSYTYEYQTVVYFIRPCSSLDSSDACIDEIPTLVKAKLAFDGTNRILEHQAVVENVEQFQLEYGVDTNNDLSVDSFLTADSVTDWGEVQSVRVALLLKGNALDGSFTDSHTSGNGYELAGDMTTGGAAGAYEVSDVHYHRKLFTQLVQVRNRSAL